jgi:hemerythrin superfamily protein
MQSQTTLLPLRGSTVHEIVENDHETIKSLLNSLTHSAAREDRMQTLEQLKAALTIHNAMEENLIYPALAKVAGHNFETLKLYNETASADMLLFEIDMMLKEGEESKFSEKAEKLQEAVFKHIDEEEKSAMPHLQKGADTKESQLLLQSVHEFRGAMQFTLKAMPPSRTYTGEIGSPSPQRSS